MVASYCTPHALLLKPRYLCTYCRNLFEIKIFAFDIVYKIILKFKQTLWFVFHFFILSNFSIYRIYLFYWTETETACIPKVRFSKKLIWTIFLNALFYEMQNRIVAWNEKHKGHHENYEYKSNKCKTFVNAVMVLCYSFHLKIASWNFILFMCMYHSVIRTANKILCDTNNK